MAHLRGKCVWGVGWVGWGGVGEMGCFCVCECVVVVVVAGWGVGHLEDMAHL